MSRQTSQSKALYKMIFTALMAAIVFVSTMFIKIDIVTPVGPTMIKAGNIFCLLSGLLFGGVPGALASGIGSALFDMLDPLYIASAPFTFIRFALMGLIVGLIAHGNHQQGLSFKRNLVAVTSASLFSFVFYIVESIIKQMLAGSAFNVAFMAVLPKMATSGLNYVIAIIFSLLLAIPLNKALKKAGVLDKI